LTLSDYVIDKLKREAAESMLRVATFAKSLGLVVDQRITDTSSSIVETIGDFA